jgi:hypothetical protein
MSIPDIFDSAMRSVLDRSSAKVGEKARYTARCGGYFGEPAYIVLVDVHDAAGVFIARAINGNTWKGDASTNGPLFDEGRSATRGRSGRLHRTSR